MNRQLGRDGPQLFPIGLGCMGMSEGYGERAERDEQESIATIHRALDLGVNLLDTADIYGPYENEKLVGRALQGRRSQAVLATKFGFVWHAVLTTGRPGAFDRAENLWPTLVAGRCSSKEVRESHALQAFG